MTRAEYAFLILNPGRFAIWFTWLTMSFHADAETPLHDVAFGNAQNVAEP
ncbi:MAG: hypothetical protein QMC36_05985 [Patescibacteria group bacterium]